MSVRRLVCLASLAGVSSVLAGCVESSGPIAGPEPIALQAPPVDPIPDFVAYLRRHGIVAEEDAEGSFRWKVVEPPSDGPYAVVISLLSFPPGTSKVEIEEHLLPISLAHLLNAPARLAMSYPGLQSRPGVQIKDPPDPLSLPTSRELIRLFEAYPGPEGTEKSAH